MATNQGGELPRIHGTQLLPEDTREVYRQKLARITLDSMVQFVGLLDAQGTVLEINKVALDAAGIKLSAVEGRPFWTTFWWQVSPEINDLLRDCIRRAAAGELVRWDTQIYGRPGGKETLIIEACLTPVKDEQGNVLFIAAEARDVTEKKAYEREIARQREQLARLDAFWREASAALTESETKFRALVTASSDVVYRMSPDWTEMRHLEGREFIPDTFEPSRTWVDRYIDTADQASVLEKISAAVRTRRPFTLEHRVRRLDGSIGWASSRAVPLFDARGEIVEWIGMASDITERKRLEESLRRADRRKDEFLATLAHELRNPLAPIRNAIHLLKATDVQDLKVRAAREIVERQVHHMVRLIDDLMDVSRITLGQITLRRDIVNLRGVLTDALEAASPAIDANRHALSVELPADLLHVDGDATRLSQVFQNLLQNAAKYTPPGGQIAVRTECIGDEVRVCVRDNGIGIARDHQSRVFELFTRLHPQDQLKTTGLGIGLALAKQLVEHHGGRLELRSEGLGKGSEFIVALPLCASAGQAQERLSAPTSREGAARARRVLIVDDNKDAAESLAMLLELDGSPVRIATTGTEALSAFAQTRPDVVLLDIGLPDIDGYEVARRIRADGGGREPILIALTGWGQSEDKRRAAEAGFDEHLTKPVDPEVLRMLLGMERLTQ